MGGGGGPTKEAKDPDGLNAESHTGGPEDPLVFCFASACVCALCKWLRVSGASVHEQDSNCGSEEKNSCVCTLET